MDKIYYACPFCGSHKIRLNAAYTGGENDCWCECGDCHAQGPHAITKVEALVSWNKRDNKGALAFPVMDEFHSDDKSIKMKFLLADDANCIINTDCIESALVELDPRMKLENGKIVPCDTYIISVYTKNGKKKVVADNMGEADAKAKLRKIGSCLCTDTNFLIELNEV